MTVKRLYETMYLLRPDLPDQESEAAIAKYQEFLVQQEAEDITTQHRGRRRLAYDIKGHREGIYVQVNYTATPKTIESLEKSMRLADDVIRYMTIKLEPEVIEEDAEEIDAEAPVEVVVETPVKVVTETPVKVVAKTPVVAEAPVPVVAEAPAAAEAPVVAPAVVVAAE